MKLVDRSEQLQASTSGGSVETLPPAGHFRSLLTPLLALAFLLIAPNHWWGVLGFLLLPFGLDLWASRSPAERRQPSGSAPRLLFELLVWVHFALQWANLILLAVLIGDVGWLSLQAPVALLLVSLASSLSAGAGGHELIHRRTAFHQWMGRLLLSSILYEHLFTEHLRGHHRRVGTLEDPTTARLGESLWAYLLRSTPGQVASAWQLEGDRLRQRSWPGRLLRNRVLHGFLLEASLCGAFLWALGWTGLAVFLVQAVVANFLFQVINYFQHWGVQRNLEVPGAQSWDTTNHSSLFSMIGLARHTDHHLHPGRPFQELEFVEEANLLPAGYGGMVWLSIARNGTFQRLMTEELARRGRLPAAS